MLDWGRRRMKVFSSKKFSDSSSDNRKSKTCTAFDKLRPRACRGKLSRSIQNQKLAGFLAILVFLAGYAGMAAAQQPKLYRIGVILPGGPLYETVEGLRYGMKELGLQEGKQFTLEIRDTKGDPKIAEEAARNFEREKFNLLYVIANSVVAAAKSATVNIPIVFSVGSDPVASGLVTDFATPGGRLTGVHYPVKDL